MPSHKPVLLPVNKLISPSMQYDMDDIYQELYAIEAGSFITLDKVAFRKMLAEDMLLVK